MKYKTLIITLISTTFLSAIEVGVVEQVKGIVQIKRSQKIVKTNSGDKLHKNDIIITKQNSSISILLNNGKIINLGENSILPINKHLLTKKSTNYFTASI